jgi:spore maturation protein CgeB
MKKPSLDIVVLGLSLSSSWGNGHATTYRALIRSLAKRGHRVLFLERNAPWYAGQRDLERPAYCDLKFYDHAGQLEAYAQQIRAADAVIIGSFVPDGIAVIDWVLDRARGDVAFYDIDTPVTLSSLQRGECSYLAASQIPRFAIYFSFTGGPTLDALESRWGAKAAHALYCSADAKTYRPMANRERRWKLGYLGTYSADRQPAVERFIIEVARRKPDHAFVVAGAQYPKGIRWPRNVDRLEHVPPSEHAEFYASLDWALNLTRKDMRAAGYSPSVRLFEAAACGTAIISDEWPGLESYFKPDREIVIARDANDVTSALSLSEAVRKRIGRSGRRRVLHEHTSDRRAEELESFLLKSKLRSEAQRPFADNDRMPFARGANLDGEWNGKTL